jgi:hypothetical protein
MGNKIDYSKRFWIIGYYNFYPEGGLNDVLRTFDNTEEMYKSAETDPLCIDFIKNGNCYFFDKELGIKLDAQL